jgi:GntR family transcriptional regulator
MLLRPNPASGVPICLQLMEQVKHAVETGALRPGEQLPGIRPLAEELPSQCPLAPCGISAAP